jgi:peptidoglycan/LPS O-acetylase OafA/YrhL
LDALRFYAAVAVVILHVSHALPDNGGIMAALVGLPFLNGADAVTLFFVLSGFLITYLLLSERSTSGDIDAMGFQYRRALRIWPLYLLVVGVGFIIIQPLFPHHEISDLTPADIVAVIALLPNIAFASAQGLGFLSHLWSIGAEEQFYLLWPTIIKHRLSLTRLLFAVIALRYSLLVVATLVQHRPLMTFLSYDRFEAMIIGALGATALFYRTRWLWRIYAAERPAWFALAFFVLIDIPHHALKDGLLALLFMIVVVCTASKPSALLRVDGPRWRALGALSYGVYMWHWLWLQVGEHIGASVYGFPGLFAFVFTTTLFSAMLSYRYIERPFLRLKDRYGRATTPSTPATSVPSAR